LKQIAGTLTVYNEAQEVMDVMRGSRSNGYDERLKK
jgi:hypothetical protein